MNCKEKKNPSSGQNTEGCGSLALSQRTQETGRGHHFPHSTGLMETWQMKKKSLGLSDWSIMNCNSTVSTVPRETNLGTVVPFET